MLVFQKWLVVCGALLPFGLYGTHAVWRSLEFPSAPPDVKGLDMAEVENAKNMKEKIDKNTDKSKKNIQSAAMFDPPVEETPFKDVLSRRAWVAKNAVAFDDFRETQFGGDKDIKDRFDELRKSLGDLGKIERELNDWFTRDIDPNALTALESFKMLCAEYRKAKASPVRIADYEMRGRHAIANSFSTQLLKKYDLLIGKAVLPMKPSDATSFEKEMEELTKMYDQFDLIYSNAPEQARKNSRIEDLANSMAFSKAECQACNELCKLFFLDPVRMPPADITAWFLKVGSFMSKLSTSSTKALIKQKVQQFCAAVIPEKLALDDHVLNVDGTLFKRDQLRAMFEKNGGMNTGDKDYFNERPLSLDPAELNERTHGDMKFTPPGYVPGMISHSNGTISPKRLKPTPRSVAAFDFFKARQQVPSDNGWKRVIVDQLLEAAAESGKTPGQQWDPLSLPGEPKQKPYEVVQKLNAIRAAMTNVATQSLFPDR